MVLVQKRGQQIATICFALVSFLLLKDSANMFSKIIDNGPSTGEVKDMKPAVCPIKYYCNGDISSIYMRMTYCFFVALTLSFELRLRIVSK